jgi:hypothetical protein
MSWFEKLFGRTPDDPIQPDVRENDDGSVSTTYRFQLGGDQGTRPVRDDVVEAIDDALGAHGEVMHAIDPSRIVDFDGGGPPVWSIGYVTVEHEGQPYWLFVTYGFSGVLSPTDFRAEYTHEYSIAVPAVGEVPTWPAALLRHMARYVLNTRAELRVGDNIPCQGPITRVPFAPEHHAGLPDTPLDTLLVGIDPLLPTIDTPHGPIEVRRMVGLRSEELRFVQQWNGEAFFAQMAATFPPMTCDLQRGSLLDDPAFVDPATASRDTDGSSLGVLYCQAGWAPGPDGSTQVHFPGGADAAQIQAVLQARLPFDRPLILQGPHDLGPIVFEPAPSFGLTMDGPALVLMGSLSDPQLQGVLAAIDPTGPGSTLTIRAPS